MANRLTTPNIQFLDSQGEPLAAGLLWFYVSGTSTPTDTYSDDDLAPGHANTNPVVLNAAGFAGDVFLDPTITYKVVLETAATPPAHGSVIWTADPVVDLATNINAKVQIYAGNPQGNVAGNAGTIAGNGASMVWDSTNHILYICTTTGTATTAVWVPVGGTFTGVADVRTNDHTVVAADNGRIQVANKATAISFPLTAVATIGSGFLLPIKNIGAGVLTLNPAGAELIEGLATYQFTPGEGALIYCNGATWRILTKFSTLQSAEVTVADSATPAIGAAASVNVLAAGSTTITDFDTVQAGITRVVRWASARTLTYNATSMILISAETRAVSAGDISTFRSEGSGNWREIAYTRDTSFPIISPPGFRNIARRNGGLEVWQRGAGGAASFAVAATSTAYTADGWYLSTGVNQASVVSQAVTIIIGSRWAAKVLRNSGQTGTSTMLFAFPLDTDELYPMLGSYVRLSMVLKAGANFSPTSGNIDIILKVGTASPVKYVTGYAGATNVISVTQEITTVATRYQFSSAAVIPTTTRQAEIQIQWTPVGTAGADDSFYIDDVQLEIVPNAEQTASPFERLNFHEQLQLCKRHYQKSFPYSIAPATNTGLQYGLKWTATTPTSPWWFAWLLPVAMRLETTGTGILYNEAAANAQIHDTIVGQDWSASQINLISDSVVLIEGTPNAGMLLGHLITVDATIDAGI